MRLNPQLGDQEVGVRRLSEETRWLASAYLTGQFRSRLQPCDVRESTFLASGLSPAAARLAVERAVVEQAALNILPCERLAGAASFIEACWHRTPGMEHPGWSHRGSISHTTVDFDDALRKGLRGLESELKQQLSLCNDYERPFVEGLLGTIDCMRLWVRRYLAAYRALLRDGIHPEYAERFQLLVTWLERVPEEPPRNFPEAVQALWLFFEYLRLHGNWSGIGRIDLILGDYLERDLAAGTITQDEARELLAHFWIKGTEWCQGLLNGKTLDEGASGDAQHYQNIILSGLTPDGRHLENAVTFLVLDIIEELHISDYPVAVRLNEHSSEQLLQRIAAVQLLGGGIVSVYNEPLVLRGLERLGYAPEVARNFTNDGCWEVIIPGQTCFGYRPFDALLSLQEVLFAEKTPRSWEQLWQGYHERLAREIEHMATREIPLEHYEVSEKETGELEYRHCDHPDREHILALLMPSCRQRRRAYYDHGATYEVKAIHAGGLPDVANSLLAIRHFVFEQGWLTLPELVEILRADWAGHETLRQRFLHELPYYGQGDEAADAMMRRVVEDFAASVERYPSVCGIRIPAGVSTFGREIAFAAKRLATAYGAHAHEYLAPNLSPTPQMNRGTLTSIIASYCRLPLERLPNGCPLDVRLSLPAGTAATDAALRTALAGCLRTLVQEGGFYLQVDTVSAELLRQAQQEPDRFPNLVVRISGWSARFASLGRQWQDMLIRRAAQQLG